MIYRSAESIDWWVYDKYFEHSLHCVPGSTSLNSIGCTVGSQSENHDLNFFYMTKWIKKKPISYNIFKYRVDAYMVNYSFLWMCKLKAG